MRPSSSINQYPNIGFKVDDDPPKLDQFEAVDAVAVAVAWGVNVIAFGPAHFEGATQFWYCDSYTIW